MKLGLLAVVVLVVACSAEFTLPDTYVAENGETLKMPQMPPRAGDIVHEKDPKAEALIADQEAEDPVMTLLEEAMANSAVSAEQKDALKRMDDSQAKVKAEQKRLLKRLAFKQKKAAKQQAGFDRFAALRSKFPTFMETEKDVGHTKEDPEHRNSAPVRYSVTPEGEPAEEASAHLASGADASKAEDWAVHKATYETLNPDRIQLKHKQQEEKEELKPPTPLKDAQGEFHKGLDTIDETKKIIATPLVKLTLDQARDACSKVRELAKTNCDTNKHDTGIFCKTEGRMSEDAEAHQKDCDGRMMKNAANCKVGHQTAMNKCYSLWNQAKTNIADARAKAAAPMQHTDKNVKDMTEGSKKCATLMAKANTDCTAAMAKYQGECKKTMAAAIEDTVIQIQLPEAPKTTKSAKQAQKQAEESKTALKEAEHTLSKETAQPGMKKAIEECELKKNTAKRTCVAAVHKARNTCDKMTSSFSDDRDTSR